MRRFSRNCLGKADLQKRTSHVSKLESPWCFNSEVSPMTHLFSYFADPNPWQLKAKSAEKLPELSHIYARLEKLSQALPGFALQICLFMASYKLKTLLMD